MKIVLIEPQIPQNTGNIVRTCAVTGNQLILVEPLGFKTNDRWLKRAGLDYWEGVDVQIIDNLEELIISSKGACYFFSSLAKRCYSSVNYSSEDFLIFGSETSGIPQHFHQTRHDCFLRIPMIPDARCLNLATSVGIVTYEAWRQQGFN